LIEFSIGGIEHEINEVGLASEAGIEPEDLSLRRPTLDEVFLHLTGPTAAENSQEVAS